jgi:2-dehydro-3-deoxygluconokinase
VVLKLGEKGCRIKTATDDTRVSAYSVTPHDTTAAGDSFNAGFLAGFLRGKSLVASADQGCRLASVVVQHPGAIIDKSLLEDFTSEDSLV